MKQIIPFKKELLFKTKISEITSISLEHTLALKDDDLISGEFYIMGDYKMTEGSINREKFQFKLPFDIALDSRYDIDSIVIDIDNFYYEIVNNEFLKVNIDVYVEGDKVEDDISIIQDDDRILVETLSNDVKDDVLLESSDEVCIEARNNEDNAKDLFKEEYTPAIEISKSQSITLENENENHDFDNVEFNLFENINNSDTYVTYYVYRVKVDDKLEEILTRYDVTKEEIAHYNNLENVTPGTKLIIPSCNNE